MTKARDLTGVFGRLPLRVVEVSWNRDDGVFHAGTQITLGSFLHLRQDESADL